MLSGAKHGAYCGNKSIHTLCFLFVFVICVLSAHFAAAKPDKQNANGCGPARYGALVPDSILGQCTFKRACDVHDLCYGKCLKGGPLYGKATCRDEKAKKKRRASCDITFRDNIRKFNPGKKVCSAFANLYYWAVSTYGEGNFYGVDGDIPPEITEFRKFFQYVEKNPNAFDLDDVNKAIKNMSSEKGSLPIISFEAFKPALVIFQTDPSGGRNVTEIKGKK